MVTVGGLARVAMDYDEQNNYNCNTATFGITQFTFFSYIFTYYNNTQIIVERRDSLPCLYSSAIQHKAK